MTNLARILEEKGIKQSWLVKKTGNYNNIIASIVGIIVNVVGVWTFDMVSKVNIVSAVAVGILAGLAASGLYTLKKVQ